MAIEMDWMRAKIHTRRNCGYDIKALKKTINHWDALATSENSLLKIETANLSSGVHKDIAKTAERVPATM